jgi:hypothetical protein
MYMAARCLILIVALLSATGCPTLQGPGYLHPGTAQYQQTQAQRFDPYPVTDVAPDMAARPLAYIRPAGENERAQNTDSFIKRYHQAPPLDLYRAPRAMTGPPVVPVPVMTEAPLYGP